MAEFRGFSVAAGGSRPDCRSARSSHSRHRRQNDKIELAPHRAVYDLKLALSRAASGRSSGVRGRILYDFTGTSCEGYALQFRQVSEIDTGEGKASGQRSARHHLGRRRARSRSVQVAEFHQSRSSSTTVDGKRRAQAAARRRQSEQARRQDASISRSPAFSRPSTCAGSSWRRAPARRCSSCRSSTARKPARRSTTR